MQQEGDWNSDFPFTYQPVGISTYPNDGFFTVSCEMICSVNILCIHMY